MARLESAPSAVRSTALGRGRGSSLGFDTVKFLGDIPNKLLVKGGDSGKVGRPNSPEAAFKSVKAVDVTNNIPVRGEVPQPQGVTETIYFPKPLAEPVIAIDPAPNPTTTVEPQVEANSQIIFPVRPATGIVVEPVARVAEVKTPEVNPDLLAQQSFAIRLRARANALLRGRVQPVAAPVTETSSAVKTQPETAVQPRIVYKTEIPAAARTTTETKKLGIPTDTKVENPGVKNNSQTKQEILRRLIGWDIETNSQRLRALTETFNRLSALDPQGIVRGVALAKESLIGKAKSLKSKWFFQAGEDEREDGGQRRMEDRLSLVGSVGQGSLKDLVEDNTAVEASERPIKPATQRQFDAVLILPKDPFPRYEPVDKIVRIDTKTIETTEGVEAQVPIAYNVPPVSETVKDAEVSSGLETSNPVMGNILDIVDLSSRLFGGRIGINNVADETFESMERQLVLAAQKI